jgi:small-conductance mechanosensitive channel
VELLSGWIDDLRTGFVSFGGLGALRALLLLAVGIVIARVVGIAIVGALGDQLGAHRTPILRRVSRYAIIALFSVAALHELGFQLGVLLGAAGILSVAIGFASQTAASNLVSGLFLIGEGPFQVGEVIKIADTTGEVLSIDLLSVKLRTFDNLLVRIPNESVMKAQVTNLTRFPVRRFDMSLSVAYRHDLDDVEVILRAVAEANPLCLDEPKPLVIVLGFRDSGVEIQLSVWALREQFLPMRNSMHRDVKRAFERENIEIPYPHRKLIGGNKQ